MPSQSINKTIISLEDSLPSRVVYGKLVFSPKKKKKRLVLSSYKFLSYNFTSFSLNYTSVSHVRFRIRRGQWRSSNYCYVCYAPFQTSWGLFSQLFFAFLLCSRRVTIVFGIPFFLGRLLLLLWETKQKAWERLVWHFSLHRAKTQKLNFLKRVLM